MLYAVVDSTARKPEDKLVGYHEKKKVVGQYYYSLKKEDKLSRYKFVKCKKKSIKKIPSYYEYHLVRLGRNYIPAMYYAFAKDDVQTLAFEYKHTIEILTRIFELEDLSQNNRDVIEKAIFIVQNVMDAELDCVIPPHKFNEMVEMYSEYCRNTFRSEQISDDDWVPFFDLDDGEGLS